MLGLKQTRQLRRWGPRARSPVGGGLLFHKKLGTGVRDCKLLDKTSFQTATVGVFADKAQDAQKLSRVWHRS